MMLRLSRDQIFYGLVIVLSVIALTLAVASPSCFMDNRVVYQGF